MVQSTLKNVNQGNPLNNYSLPKQLYNFSSQKNSLWIYSCMQTQYALVTVPWELCKWQLTYFKVFHPITLLEELAHTLALSSSKNRKSDWQLCSITTRLWINSNPHSLYCFTQLGHLIIHFFRRNLLIFLYRIKTWLFRFRIWLAKFRISFCVLIAALRYGQVQPFRNYLRRFPSQCDNRPYNTKVLNLLSELEKRFAEP